VKKMAVRSDIGKFHIRLDFNPGGTLKGELLRYKAPRIVEYLVKKLPIRQRIRLYKDNQIFITTGLNFGLEKGVTAVKTGDLAYWPVGDAFCIYKNDMETYSKVNIIGKIVDGSEYLQAITAGAIHEINKI